MLHTRLKALFSAFNQAGIRWCLLRLPESYSRKGGDIDLFLSAEDIQPARRVIASQQFARLPAWKPALHFLTFDKATGQWLWLHIVTELSFGRYELLKTGCEADCLMRRQADPLEKDLFTLSTEDAFWELLLHGLVNKGRIAVGHRDRLQQLVQTGCLNSPLTVFIELACPPGWNAESIAGLVAAGHWDQLEALAPALNSAWMRHARVGPGQLLRAKAAQIFAQLVTKPHSRGMTVALLGPDGAGKSTLISGLQETWLLPVSPLYMGLTGGLLPYVNRLWLPFLVIPGRLIIFWTRYLLGKYHQSRGRLVIYDRYIYDWQIPTPYPLNRLQRTYRWIDGHCLPGPDKVFILDAPGEVMFSRKGEYNPEMLEDWRQHFLSLRGQISQSELVDTTLPRQNVLAEVTDRIWQDYALRWIESQSDKEC